MSQKQVWENISPKWNEFKTVISPTVEKFLEKKSGKLLDLGCGSGRNFIKKDNLNWYGIDFSKNMIKYARKKAKKIGIPIKLQVSYSTKLPFEDDYFDNIICVAVLHCIDTEEKRKDTIKEIYRTLKPGATALISVWGASSPRLKNKSKECFIPWTTKEDKTAEQRYTYIFDKSEIEKLVEKAGLKIIRSWEERNINLLVGK